MDISFVIPVYSDGELKSVVIGWLLGGTVLLSLAWLFSWAAKLSVIPSIVRLFAGIFVFGVVAFFIDFSLQWFHLITTPGYDTFNFVPYLLTPVAPYLVGLWFLSRFRPWVIKYERDHPGTIARIFR